jgi:hypothetical protein
VFKVCSKCKESKSLDCFGKCNTAKDGKQWQCKTCQQTYKKHKEKLRRNTDPSYKLITNQRTRITGILKKHKTDKTLNLLGCSAQFLRTYIENKFLEGMTWDNYGKHGWHIDHIIPCSSFNLTDSTQQQICFHYTNLQPLWAIDNLKKSNKILSKG